MMPRLPNGRFHNCAKPPHLYGVAPPTEDNPDKRGLTKIDGRTKAGRAAKEFRAALVAHVGGSPNTVQKELIERAVILQLKCSLMDQQIVKGIESEYSQKTYC